MFTFLAGPFLWFATAAIIPLALHLFQRRKKVTVKFSTLRFLKLAQRKSTSRVRMENFLLWLLRTLVLVLLALAFALPVLRRQGLGGLLGQSRRTVALVVDASFSMGYRSGSRDVWQEALETAGAVIGGLRDGDEVCVYLAADDAVPLLERPTKDLAFALNAVRALRPRPGASRLQPAVAAATASLEEAGAREKELYILTDGQALPWASFEEAAGATAAKPDPSLTVFVAALGATAPENASPSNLEVRPGLLLAGRPVALRAEVAASGAPRSLGVSLSLDGSLAGRRDLAVGGATAEPALFNLASLPAGAHAAEVSVGEDGLPMDDTLYAVLSSAQRLRIVVIAAPEQAFFLRRALRPSEDLTLFDVAEVAPADSTAEAFADTAAVLLNDALPLPGQTLERLEAFAQAGGTVAVFPGDGGGPADYEAWTTLPVKSASVRSFAAGEGRRTLRLAAPRDPIFASLKLPPGSVPSVAFKRALAPGEAQPDTETLLSAGEDLPFLLRRRVGQGQVLLFACSADRRWSDFPITPVFLPLLHQICLDGAGGLNATLAHRGAERLVFADRGGRVRDGSVVLTPSGERRTVREWKEEGKTAWMIEDATEPGIYLLEDGGGAPAPLLAVNVPREESDLTPAEPETLGARMGRPGLAVAADKAALMRQIEEHRVGRPLGETLLWAALILATLEIFWANRVSRSHAPLTDGLRVDPSGRVREAA